MNVTEADQRTSLQTWISNLLPVQHPPDQMEPWNGASTFFSTYKSYISHNVAIQNQGKSGKPSRVLGYVPMHCLLYIYIYRILYFFWGGEDLKAIFGSYTVTAQISKRCECLGSHPFVWVSGPE